MKSGLLLGLAAAACVAISGSACANDLGGTWLRESGASHLKFAPCGGGAICGNIVWIKPGTDTKAKVGQRIFSGMKSDGANSWSGSAFNPEDGQTYTGKMTLAGNTLTTSGCVMGGMICKSTTWTKVP